MTVDLTADEAKFLIAALEAIRVQNKSGLQIKHSVVGKLLDVLPDEQDQTANSSANTRL